MASMSRNNDKGETSDFAKGTLDENAPRSEPLRNRRAVILVVTIVTVLVILGTTLGILLPNNDSTKESSKSIGDSSSSSAQNSSPSDEAPSMAQSSTPTTVPVVVPVPSPSPSALTEPAALPSVAATTMAPTAPPLAGTPSPSAAPLTPSPSQSLPTTPSPTNSDPTIQACLDQYQCQPDHSDRFGPETPLLTGDSLCNDNMRFGITPSGVFQFQNCDTQERKIMFEDTTGSVAYFSMSSIGTFRLMDQSDNIVWQRECSLTITFTQQCRSNPDLPCPYL